MTVGLELEHRWIGSETDGGLTLVFLHEGLGCAAMWRDFPDALAARTGLRALVYSRKGYGRSPPVEVPRQLSYMHDEARSELPRMLDALGIRRAILIGHSDGGSIALIHAAMPEAKERIAALILEAPHVFVEDVSVRSIEQARDQYVNGDLRPKLERYHGANTDCAFWGWNRAWLDPGFRSWNLEALLPSVTAPTLVVQGVDDPYGTLAQVDAIARQNGLLVKQLILEKCGHSPHRDQRDATLEGMSEFIRSVTT